MEGKREKYLIRMRDECANRRKNWILRQRLDIILQVIVIFGSATLPVLLNLHQVPILIPTILSIIITACAAMAKYFRFEEWGRIHRLTYRKLSTEIDNYDYGVGKYKGLNEDDAFDQFVQDTSAIMDEHMKLVNVVRKEPEWDQMTGTQPDHQPVADGAKN